MNSVRTPSSIVIGIVLIVAPLIAWALKLLSLGWMIVFVMMGPIVLLLAGYVVQIVIAAQGFFSRKELFGTGKRRATIAAWATSIGAMLLGIFMPDGGDSGYGSTFQVWLGSYGPNAAEVHAATDALNDVLWLLIMAVWLGGFVWLFVEWIIGLAHRRRVKRAAGAATPLPA